MCLQLPFEASDVSQVSEGGAGGREFQIDDPENGRLVLCRSMRGRGGIKLFELYLSWTWLRVNECTRESPHCIL